MFEWLSERIEQAHNVFQEFCLDWTFILNAPATEVEIQACEVALGIPLPPSYLQFLLRHNGAHLFCSNERETPHVPYRADFGIIIHGTDNLIKFNQEKKEIFTDEEWGSLIAFCNLASIGSGDFCGLDPQQMTNSEYAVLYCFHEISPAEWREARIASSFADWLERIFSQVVDDKKQPEYWLEAESSLAEETPYALIRQGLKKAQRQDYTGAFADFEQLIRLDPTNDQAYYHRGNLCFTLGNYQGAIENYNQAIRFKPDTFVVAYNKRGLARLELKDYQGAVEDFTQALQRSPGAAEIYNNRGNARSQLGDRQGAIDDYEKAADPDNHQTYYKQGNLCFIFRDYEGAIENYNQAIRFKPDGYIAAYAKPYNKQGLARFKLKDYEGAIEDFNQALQINSEVAEIYSNRGDVRSQLGDRQGAMEDYQKAADLQALRKPNQFYYEEDENGEMILVSEEFEEPDLEYFWDDRNEDGCTTMLLVDFEDEE